MTEIEKTNIKEIVNIIGNAELSNKCHSDCFINTDFDNKCSLCRSATALFKADYRKQSDTVKEFIEKVKAKLQKHRETLIYPETEEDEAYDQGCNYGLDLAIEDMQNIAKLFYNDGDSNACEMQAKNKEDNQ